jgi:hypothetical protein
MDSDGRLRAAPKQHNGFDCGIFTLTNIALLAEHIPLHAQSYTNPTFLPQDTRKRIALIYLPKKDLLGIILNRPTTLESQPKPSHLLAC